MSLLNRLRPKWQNSDPDVRADAVRQLGKDDVELLTAVAQGDTDPRVRRIAVKKLDSPRLLLEIAETDEDEALARFARRRAQQLLVDIACDDRDLEESKRALGLLRETRYAISVVDKARFEDLRQMAFERLNDDASLAELVCRGKDPEWRSKALDRVGAPSALRTIVLDENASEYQSAALSRIESLEILQSIVDHPSASKAVRRQAMSRLEELAPPDHPVNVRKRHERFEKLVARAEALVESAAEDQGGAVTELRRERDEILAEGAAEPALAERFEQAVEAMGRAQKQRASRAPAPEKASEPAEPVGTSKADEAREAICSRLESGEGVNLGAVIETARSEWDSLATKTGPPSRELDRRYTRAMKRLEARLEEQAQSTAESEAEETRLSELVEKAESLAESSELDEAAREWKRLAVSKRAKTIPPDHPLAARLSAASERFEARLAERKAAREEEQRRTLAKLEEIMGRVQELIAAENFSIKEADRAHREAQDFLKTMGPLPKDVSRKKARKKLMEAREALVKRAGDFKELENWKRWANEDIQAGLIRRIEALRESSDIPKVAKEMRRIHEEWKRAGSAPLEKAEELWHRYKSIRDELKSKCDEFFEKQDQERANNLVEKEALCEKVEALQDSENWSEATEEIKKLQAEWKAIGPAPQKKSDAVWKRFRKACDHFFDRRKAHFGELKDEREQNLKRKREICEKAESIKDSTDWHQTANELKQLQAEWRTIGAVPRKHSDQIWKRFRGACDYFFDRFKRRDEVEHEERVKQRETLVVEIEGLANAEADTPEAVAEQAKTLWTSWRKLGPLSIQEETLQQRFETAMDSVLSTAPGAFAGTDLDPAASRKRRTKLCEQLEAVVKEFRVVTQPFEQPLEDLAARLKDALASNTMTGGQRREKRTDWRAVSREADKIRASWLRSAPVPGEEGRALQERFEAARRELAELAARDTSRPEPVASRPDRAS